MQQLQSTNELVLRFANVNGSGSASTNGMIAKSFFRMGLPVGAKNIFPSNIQGLPTWFEIRVSEKGHTARRGGVDLMVAMNPQTLHQDIESLVTGGYLLFDSSKSLPHSALRKDINLIDIPLTTLCQQEFSVARQRQLFKNVAYVGALSALLNIEFAVLEQLVEEQFAGKVKLIAPNIQALQLGFNYAKEHFDCPLPIQVKRSTAAKNQIMLSGNDAAGLGCVYAGATVAGWYPITPSTSVVDAFENFCKQFRVDPETGENRYAIVQAEDELAAIGMVLGANWNGARAFTATSGPGISLMSEFLGLAYYAEIPTVLFDIQRVGPSTGMPTRTQQSDLLSCAYASHGDTKHVLLFPANPKECFEFASQAFDLAERLQTPVIVLSDLDLGMNDWMSEPLEWDDNKQLDRGKLVSHDQLEAGQEFFRYLDVDEDGIPYRTIPGTHPDKGAFFTRGSGHDKFGRYTEEGDLYQENLDRLLDKWQTAATLVPEPLIEDKGNSYGLIHFGTTNEPMAEALEFLRADHIEVDTMRIRAFPFSSKVLDFINNHRTCLVVEQNRDAQLRSMLMIETGVSAEKLVPVLHYHGLPVNADFLVKKIGELLAQPIPLQTSSGSKS